MSRSNHFFKILQYERISQNLLYSQLTLLIAKRISCVFSLRNVGKFVETFGFFNKIVKKLFIVWKKMEFSVRDVGTLENTKNGTLVVAEINATIS